MKTLNGVLASSLVLVLSFPASAGLRCESVFGDAKIESWQEALRILSNSTDRRLKQPFEIRARDAQGKSLNVPQRAEDFTTAAFVVGKLPSSLPGGARVIKNAVFGYDLDSFRILGRINYLVIDGHGKVLEVGGGSKELLMEFRHHVMGRALAVAEMRTISEINRKLLSDLRQSPAGRQRLAEFAKKRGWPQGLETDYQLAYFSEDIIPLKEWAAKNGYTLEQMRDAGWFTMRFDQDGRPQFITNSEDSIKIPFFGEASETSIPVWRSRAVHPKPGEPKYRGWQMDRALDREYTVAETLFNGWKLKQAEGQTIVITEGEFKCMVAEKSTGILTVGIPGISQFDAKMAAAILGAKPKDVVIILDRDPRGKGLMRVDEITDSERAAYSIARQLQDVGVNVKVGVLPDVFEGGKVGIDDLILGKGVTPYLKTIEGAMSPEVYARQIGLDANLLEAYRLRQALRKGYEHQQRAAERGSGDLTEQEDAKIRTFVSWADQQFDSMIRQRYPGAKQYNRPTIRFPYIPATRMASRLARREFAENILIMDYVPRDIAEESHCAPAPCAALEMDQATLNNILEGRMSSPLVEKAHEIARAANFVPRSRDDQAQLILAAKLSHEFPPDDYNMAFSAPIAGGERAPILISKKGEGTVVAMARLRLKTSDAQSETLFQRIWSALRTPRKAELQAP